MFWEKCERVGALAPLGGHILLIFLNGGDIGFAHGNIVLEVEEVEDGTEGQ